MLALVHSTAEYCVPVWCRSAHTHLIDLAINDALQIVTGCLRPTPSDNLPILASDNESAELRRSRATLSLGRRAMKPRHLLHSALTCCPSSADARHLKSRHRFVHATQQHVSLSDIQCRSSPTFRLPKSLQGSLMVIKKTIST